MRGISPRVTHTLQPTGVGVLVGLMAAGEPAVLVGGVVAARGDVSLVALDDVLQPHRGGPSLHGGVAFAVTVAVAVAVPGRWRLLALLWGPVVTLAPAP